jgi:hypothetical protein
VGENNINPLFIFLNRFYPCNADHARLDFDAKQLLSQMKEKALLISEKGALADKISPGVLKSLLSLSDKQ